MTTRDRVRIQWSWSKMWGFHVIPMVPTMTSFRSLSRCRISRMLGYQFPNILHYNKSARRLQQKQYIVNNELIPTEEELQKTYMINLVRQATNNMLGHRLYMYRPSRCPERRRAVYTTAATISTRGDIRVEDNGGRLF
ncbi:hypothetical protein FNV43_RR02611 [Rhamnella rubrinervis]|uniref:Uncharacterized protein n=1 Tax=Rhamnella rubrinervis TaxID=2594499 RepID=A0A8K0HTV9_9ROSA|nr:hypothetical protein FNV43_RR02611 [Rhamnella rubrinervis]